LRIVQPVNPVVLKNLCHELDVMGTLLGHAHDLSFLRARLLTGAGKATWQRQAEELGGVVETSEEDLRCKALDLAEHFFAERPRDFGAHVREWLGNWGRKEKPSLAEQLL